MTGAEHWESEAGRWAAWARAAGHDAYWYYREAFFALVPPPGRATLEVGCGEGRVTRDLAARGHRVTAVVADGPVSADPELPHAARPEGPRRSIPCDHVRPGQAPRDLFS